MVSYSFALSTDTSQIQIQHSEETTSNIEEKKRAFQHWIIKIDNKGHNTHLTHKRNQ